MAGGRASTTTDQLTDQQASARRNADRAPRVLVHIVIGGAGRFARLVAEGRVSLGQLGACNAFPPTRARNWPISPVWLDVI
jgi:hypothetical protein